MLSSTFVSLALGATLASSFPVALPDAWNKMLRRNNGGEKREGGFIVKTTLDRECLFRNQDLAHSIFSDA